MNSYSTQPDTNKYCCVKNEYLIHSDLVHTWNDRGSGAARDVSLWTVVRAGGDAYGIDAGTFVGATGYSKPTNRVALLLKGDGSKVKDVWSVSPAASKPLNLYEVGELKLIWNDAGSGAHADVSIWRAESRDGYYPVGDIVVATHAKPRIGFLLKPTNAHGDAIRVPVSYHPIWNDGGSGADRDVTLWKVTCPGGYVSLGNVATSGGYPAVGDVYCVKSSYTTYGSATNWGYIWRDHGSGAHRDVSIFEARQSLRTQQSVRGFGAIASYSGYPGYPFLLKTDSVSYWAEKPIEKIYMYSVSYNLNEERRQIAPVKMSPTIVENESDNTQTVSRIISYTIAETSTFTFSQAIQFGIEVEFEAGIPLIAKKKTTVSFSSTTTFETGSSTTKEHMDTIDAKVTLPSRSKLTAFISGTEYTADIPYTAQVKKTYYDGTIGYGTISGVYRGVAINEITVTYGETEEL